MRQSVMLLNKSRDERKQNIGNSSLTLVDMQIQLLRFSMLPIGANPAHVQACVFPVHLGYHDAECTFGVLVAQQGSPCEVLIDIPIRVDDVVADVLLHLAQVFPHADGVRPKAAGHGYGAVQLHVEELGLLGDVWTCAKRLLSSCLVGSRVLLPKPPKDFFFLARGFSVLFLCTLPCHPAHCSQQFPSKVCVIGFYLLGFLCQIFGQTAICSVKQQRNTLLLPEGSERPELLDAVSGQASCGALLKREKNIEEKQYFNTVITLRNVQADFVGEPSAIEADPALVGASV